MPIVNIKLADDRISKEKKEELIVGVTQLLQDVLGKNPASTLVLIEEVHTDNWGVGGEQLTEKRKRTS